MAFDKLDTYTDELVTRCRRFHALHDTHFDQPADVFALPGNIADRCRLNVQMDEIKEALLLYYQTVLSTAKFKGQRDYCRRAMLNLDQRWFDQRGIK